ncbi:hypothetical protein [uncultured Mediterranea sp.]|uniref:hypothetical protein n=1 Tax=uncultured Mediterranea sp. TaxID=1926662 RepID=UPI0027D94EF5|nr:hypothetical protein [uncultured Mediterranea sp.]
MIFNQLYFIVINTTVTAVITGTEKWSEKRRLFPPKRAKSHTFEGEKTGKSRKRTCPKKLISHYFLKKKKLFPAEIFTKEREFRPGIEAHGPFLRTDTQAPSAGGTETEKRRGVPRKTLLSTLKNNALVLLTRSAVLLTHFQLLAASFFWPARENGLSLWYTDGGKARQAEEKTYNFARIRFLFVTFAFYNKDKRWIRI